MAHILVVDDDGDLRALLKTALERDGHQVSLLDRGGAVSEAHCRWADCILLDVMMPGEDGFATCRRIRALAACPILFLTAKTEEADVLTGLGLGGGEGVLLQQLRAAADDGQGGLEVVGQGGQRLGALLLHGPLLGQRPGQGLP